MRKPGKGGIPGGSAGKEEEQAGKLPDLGRESSIFGNHSHLF